MHDNPRPTREEQEQGPERLEEEEEMRGSLEPDAKTPGTEKDEKDEKDEDG